MPEYLPARKSLDFRRFLSVQAAVTVAVSLLGLGWHGIDIMASALMGGAVSILPSAYFFWRGKPAKGMARRRNIMNLYRAMVGKFGLTVALFALVFVAVPPSNPIFFFIAYVASQLVYSLSPWLVTKRTSHKP